MPLDPLPGRLQTLTRDQVVANFLRDVQFRNPDADVREGSDAWIEANVYADASAVNSANAVTIANGVSPSTATGTDLEDWAERYGTQKLPAVGGGGEVIFDGSTGGATIYAGDIGKSQSGLRFRVVTTDLYLPGDRIPIVGIDTGPGTNLAAGTVLTWQTPRLGSNSTAVIAAQADGSGLSGGNDEESDEDLQERLRSLRANPPAGGNDAHYQSVVAKVAGVGVQQCFTYPGILGPGSIGVTFTLRPSQIGANRIPTPAHLALALAEIRGQMPADDGAYMHTLVASPVTLVLKVAWAQDGWADAAPWPPYYASPNLVAVTGSPTATTFTLTSASLAVAPQAGQTIAFFDRPALTFRRKRILSVTGGPTSYVITCDTSNNASDANYVPSIGQACSPWSDALTSLPLAAAAYFDGLGPGEEVASPIDPGLRQRRSPAAPAQWPSTVTSRLLGDSGTASGTPKSILAVPEVADAVIVEPTIPYATPVGSPGVANLLTLGQLVVFPE